MIGAFSRSLRIRDDGTGNGREIDGTSDSKVHQPVVDGKPGELYVVTEVELLEKTVAMCIDGFYTDAVGFGNLPACLAQRQPTQDLELPVGQ